MADSPQHLTDEDKGLILWALHYTHQQLVEAQVQGEGSVTIGDRIDELEGLNYKLHFIDPLHDYETGDWDE